ncbi:MAG: hypothetical protein MUQ65_10335, partial [Armatimonadetes bacterium]|nr:hypothetical protein [Armatimonadota bacterium]
KSTRLKSELLLFLTPQIVRTVGEAAELTESERSRMPDVPRSLRSVVGPDEPAFPPSALISPEPEGPSLGVPEVEPPVVTEGQSIEPSVPSDIEAKPQEAVEEAPEEAAEGADPVAPPPDAAPIDEVPAEPEPPPEPSQ